jgi:hypothetical protein
MWRDVVPTFPPKTHLILSQNQETTISKAANLLFSIHVTAMKISNNLLALCAFHPNVWGTTAFHVQGPRAVALTQLHAARGYLQGLNDEAASTALKTASVSEMAAQQGMSKWADSGTGPKKGEEAQVRAEKMEKTKSIWETSTPIMVQGGSLRTWSESTGIVERVQVLMKTEGRPMNANLELWHGPDNTPLKMTIYCEDGGLRPFSAVVETPVGGGSNTISIRNTGSIEFPLAACVEPDVEGAVLGQGYGAVNKRLSPTGSDQKVIQGGAIVTYPFNHDVGSVQVMLKTGGRPLHARIELLQGPNNDKQVIEIYTEDGLERPFFMVIETPGTGNVVRVVNTATVEFPLTATVQPYVIEAAKEGSSSSGWNKQSDSSSSSSMRRQSF